MKKVISEYRIKICGMQENENRNRLNESPGRANRRARRSMGRVYKQIICPNCAGNRRVAVEVEK